jgi:hypothetical protein
VTRRAAKLAATRGYQAGQAASEVILLRPLHGEDREIAIGRRLAAERGLTH